LSHPTYSKESLTVYYKETNPYIVNSPTGPTGKSVSILNNYAISNNINLTYKSTSSMNDLLFNVKSNNNSVGLGAVSINNERLNLVNFTLPYNITDTVLAYYPTLTYKSVFKSFCNVIIAFFPLLIAMILVSGILAFVGIPFFRAFWLALVTSTTVGYGDEVPKTIPQKIIIGFWMLISTYFLSLFTAVLTTSLNHDYSYEPVNTGVISSTEGHRMCVAQRYDCIQYDTLDKLIKSLRTHQVDSIITDREIIEQYGMNLEYEVLGNSMHSIIVNKSYDEHKLNNYINY
jgi:hypothetical protein